MAGSHTRRNTGRVPINDSGTPKPIPTVFCAFSPASTLGLLGRYIDKDLQRATKLALKLFVKNQKHGQLQANSKTKDSKT